MMTSLAHFRTMTLELSMLNLLQHVRASSICPPPLGRTTHAMPCQAYLHLSSAIHGDNCATACQPLLDFLHMAITHNKVNQGPQF